jgi:hypothetical protein
MRALPREFRRTIALAVVSTTVAVADFAHPNRNQGLRITNINVVDLKKQAPLDRTLVRIPYQGE